MGREIHPRFTLEIIPGNCRAVPHNQSVATSVQTPQETSASLEVRQTDLLPPLKYDERGKLLPGHGGIMRKRVRATMIEKMNADPDRWQEILNMWWKDCLSPDPPVRAEARKSWVNYVDGKPGTNTNVGDSGNGPALRPVVNIILKD